MASKPVLPDRPAPLPERLARLLEARIRDAGLATGQFVSTEADLVAEFGVARASLRVALRRLERDRVLSVREGGSGGIYAGDDAEAVLLLRLSRLIRRLNPAIFEIEPVEQVVILRLIHSAAQHATDEDVAMLRRASRESEDERLTLAEYSSSRTRLMNAVYAVAGGGPLALVAQAIERAVLAVLDVSGRSIADVAAFVDRIRLLDHRLVESIVSADPVHAADAFRARRLVEAEAFAFQIKRGTMPVRIAGIADELRNGPQRRSEEIATILFDEIIAGRWPEGKRIGTDEEIAARFAVSRPTVREAVAELIEEGVVRTARGPKGGAVVIAYDPTDTIDRLACEMRAIPAYADRAGLREALFAFLPLAVQFATQLGSGPVPARTPVMRIGAMSGNPVLAALIALADAALDEPWGGAAEPAIDRLMAVIASGDVNLANRRWRELRAILGD